MRRSISFRSTVIVASLVLALPAAAIAQAVKVTPKRATPNIGAGTLSVSVAPFLVSFNLIARGAAIGNNPVNITTTWSGLAILSTISLYGYFIGSSAALRGNLSTATIPTAAVFGQMTTGLPTSYAAFTQTNPLGGAGASLKLFSQSILVGLGSGSRTDALSLKIDLTSLPTLPADTYTGTLIIQAQQL
jgi:hypothetical protein